MEELFLPKETNRFLSSDGCAYRGLQNRGPIYGSVCISSVLVPHIFVGYIVS